MSELLEKILDHKNLTQACREICANGTMIEECDGAGREDWEALKDQLRQRSYTPKTNPQAVTDKIIQQGIAQILSPVCAPAFSENCYGHCPGKSREMAVRELLRLREEGYLWVVDIDLQHCYENVPQDRLMSLVHNMIHDGDTESLIRKYLKAGIMTQGMDAHRAENAAQRASLPALLLNVLLNELDKELENRGLRFVRYADDCVIAVKSESSAKRVMSSVPDWIQRKLGFEASAVKIKIARPAKLKYLRLGYFTDIQAEPVP